VESLATFLTPLRGASHGSTSFLVTNGLQSFVGLFIFKTDLIDQFGIEFDFLLHLDGPWARVVFGIVDRDFKFQCAVAGTANPLGHFGRLAHRAAGHINPEVIAETNRLYHERVALPFSRGVAVPTRIRVGR